MDKSNSHWASSIIWYQIFPDRFFKNPNISVKLPEISDIAGAWPHDLDSPWEVTEWTSDWYQFHSHELPSHSIFHHIQRRRYCGNLQGIIEKLEYLNQLGIQGIYLTPLFYAPSSHKYDAKLLHHIDPYFGPDPETDKKLIEKEIFHDEKTWNWTTADLLALDLLENAEKLGIKVIFDGVFNHIGKTSPCFQDVEINQQDSYYKDWFQIDSFKTKETEFKYKGWFGVKELPQFLQTEDDLGSGPKEYIFSITKRWMKPVVNGINRKGVDGWRLDTAYCINHYFWKKWREHVISLNSEAFITGEIIDSFENVAKYLKGDEFDSVMNYNFWQACIEFFIFNRMKATEFDIFWKNMFQKLPQNSWLHLQNLLNSHDTARILTIIQNKGVIKSSAFDFGAFFNETLASSNKSLILTCPFQNCIKIYKMMIIFQMTFPGSPFIYYGDEVGMWGANDPDCRKPMLWSDKVYQDEGFEKGFGIEKKNKYEVNQKIYEFYQKIIEIRKKEKALIEGKFETWKVDDENKIYGFLREIQKEKVGIIFNNDEESHEVCFKEKNFINLISNKEIIGGNTMFTLESKSFLILKFYE